MCHVFRLRSGAETDVRFADARILTVVAFDLAQIKPLVFARVVDAGTDLGLVKHTGSRSGRFFDVGRRSLRDSSRPSKSCRCSNGNGGMGWPLAGQGNRILTH